MAGGWRIVHTLGSKITKLQPVGGFSAESAAAVTLFATGHLGIPVSTTHTITGAVVGVGTAIRVSAVRWGLTTRVVYAWVLTIPGSAIIAAVSYTVLRVVPAELLVVSGVLAAASALLVVISRRQRAEATVFSPP
jgi:inorganic phosphate transporter, PiT family